MGLPEFQLCGRLALFYAVVAFAMLFLYCKGDSFCDRLSYLQFLVPLVGLVLVIALLEVFRKRVRSRGRIFWTLS